MKPSIDVYKFGGAAVGTAEALRTALGHVRRAPRVIAVVSAMNGVTDLLVDAGNAAVHGDEKACADAARTFEKRHLALLPELIVNRKQCEELRGMIMESTREMRAMTDSIAVLREFTSRAHDSLAARGERVLARIFTAFAVEQGVEAAYIDTPEIIFTDRKNGSRWPNFAGANARRRSASCPASQMEK
jgi:aspartokinase/homoserine dehydrogenase 1